MPWKKAIHRISYKNYREVHHISLKNLPRLFSNVYQIRFKFTRKIIDVNDSWGSENKKMKTCRR